MKTILNFHEPFALSSKAFLLSPSPHAASLLRCDGFKNLITNNILMASMLLGVGEVFLWWIYWVDGRAKREKVFHVKSFSRARLSNANLNLCFTGLWKFFWSSMDSWWNFAGKENWIRIEIKNFSHVFHTSL